MSPYATRRRVLGPYQVPGCSLRPDLDSLAQGECFREFPYKKEIASEINQPLMLNSFNTLLNYP
jgi:hypothetical protein